MSLTTPGGDETSACIVKSCGLTELLEGRKRGGRKREVKRGREKGEKDSFLIFTLNFC